MGETTKECIDKISEYIRMNFSVTPYHVWSLEETYYVLADRCVSLERYDISTDADDDYHFVYIPCFWQRFVQILNAGDIDLTERDLFEICGVEFKSY